MGAIEEDSNCRLRKISLALPVFISCLVHIGQIDAMLWHCTGYRVSIAREHQPVGEKAKEFSKIGHAAHTEITRGRLHYVYRRIDDAFGELRCIFPRTADQHQRLSTSDTRGLE